MNQLSSIPKLVFISDWRFLFIDSTGKTVQYSNKMIFKIKQIHTLDIKTMATSPNDTELVFSDSSENVYCNLFLKNKLYYLKLWQHSKEACKTGYFLDSSQSCQQCKVYCYSCSVSAEKCDACIADQTTYRLDISVNCQCQDGYYDNGALICVKCPYNCLTCQLVNSQVQCLSCLNTSTSFRKQFKDSQTCDCIDGYYDDGVNINCIQCPYNCQTCKSQSSVVSCLSCPDSSLNFRKSFADSTTCECIEGYFDNGQMICSTCDKKCKTCKNKATQCTSCETSQFRVLQGSDCICQPNYQEYQPQKLMCVDSQTCFETCDTCDEFQNRQKCKTCYLDRELVTQPNDIRICQCRQGTFENSQNICTACNSTCKTCNGDQENNCLSCYEKEQNRIFEELTQTCKCKEGYFLQNGQCIECDQTCLTCSNSGASNCSSCNQQQNRFLNSNKQCQCNERYTQVDQNPICQQCGTYCQTCDSNKLSKCLTCLPQTNRIVNSNTGDCDCESGYFQNRNDSICLKCDKQCKTCKELSSTCTSCTNPLRIVSNNNECICKERYYEDSQTKLCQACPQNCKTCLDSVKCIECLPNFDLSSKGVCVKVFPSTTSKETVQLVSNNTSTTVYATVGTTVAGSVLLSSIQPNSSIAAQFLLLQKLNFMLLINITYPQLLYGFFKAFGGSSPIDTIDYINIITSQFVKDEGKKIYLTSQFESQDLGESIFTNSGGSITAIIVMWIITIPLIILYKNNITITNGEEIKDNYTKAIKYLCETVYPFSAVLLHEVLSLVLYFAVALQLAAISYSNATNDNLFIYKIILVACEIVYLIFITYKVFKIVNKINNYQQDKNLHSKDRIEQSVYSYLNSEQKNDSILKRNYKFIYLTIENILFPIFIIFFYFNFMVQIGLCLASQLILCLFTIILQPKKNTIDNIFLMIEQICWVLILSCILAISVKISLIVDINLIDSKELDILTILCWITISSCLLILLANPLYLIAQFIMNRHFYISKVQYFYNYLRNKCKKETKQSGLNQLSLYDFSIANTSKIWDKQTINQQNLLAAYASSRQSPTLSSISIIQGSIPQNQAKKISLNKQISRRFSQYKQTEKSNFPSPVQNSYYHSSSNKKNNKSNI